MNHHDHENASCCSERSGMSRRKFLSSSGLAAGAAFASPAWLPRVAMAGAGGPSGDVLVHIFLRFGMDGLSLVPPYQDADYYNARPTLALPPPGQTGGAIDLDGFFGLNPQAAELMTPYSNGHLAFVQASGLTHATRSHFDAQRLMEGGLGVGVASSATAGWLARHLDGVPPQGLARGLSLTDLLPFVLRGTAGTLPVKNPETFDFPGRPSTRADRGAVVGNMYANAVSPLDHSALSTFDTIALLDTIDFAAYTSAGAIAYPDTFVGQRLRSTAALIEADIGVETISLDIGDWDDHVYLGSMDGKFALRVAELAPAIEAFYLDLLARGRLDTVTTVLMSEFGRRVEENFSFGVDHGHGNTMLAMGGHINGGQVHGTWPGLAPANLDLGDLAITTDYRDVLGEIALQRLGTTNIDEVFPGHTVMPIGITV